MDDDSQKRAFFHNHSSSDRMYPDSYSVPFGQLIQPLLESTILRVPEEQYSKPPKFRFGYLFGGVIGVGSYASVKEIIHEETLIRRAVKIFDDSKRRREPKRSESMEREIRVLKRVNHHNVIRFIEMFRNEEKLKTYVVLEFCLGNVAQLVKASPRERLSESDAHFLFIQLIDGLEHLHSLGIVHKDIKPHNLLLTGDFVLKISDFGVSEELSIFQKDDLCTKVYGTLTFQAPEMISSECFSYSGFKMDIWAAGITLYYMLSGVFPFEGEAVIVLMDKICSSELEMPKSVVLSIEAEVFLINLLEKSAEQRPSIRVIRQLAWYNKSFPPEFARFMGAYDAFMKRSPKIKQDLERLYGVHVMPRDEEDFSSPEPGKLVSSASDPSLSTPVKLRKPPGRAASQMTRRRSSFLSCFGLRSVGRPRKG